MYRDTSDSYLQTLGKALLFTFYCFVFLLFSSCIYIYLYSKPRERVTSYDYQLLEVLFEGDLPESFKVSAVYHKRPALQADGLALYELSGSSDELASVLGRLDCKKYTDLDENGQSGAKIRKNWLASSLKNEIRDLELEESYQIHKRSSYNNRIYNSLVLVDDRTTPSLTLYVFAKVEPIKYFR